MKQEHGSAARSALVGEAIIYLRRARAALVAAGAPKTAERARLALSSAYGAHRNAIARRFRIDRTTTGEPQ